MIFLFWKFRKQLGKWGLKTFLLLSQILGALFLGWLILYALTVYFDL